MIPRPAMPTFRKSDDAAVPECFIGNARPGQHALVVVHGISRNAAELAARFAAHPAFAETTIIAPLFDRQRFGKYQQLTADRPGAAAADEALLALIGTLGTELRLAPGPFALFGFSGGAQMAHRFAMFHPGQVRALCIASAGWYSLPRRDLPYPYGIGDGPQAPPIGSEFLAIPTTVIVGDRDTRVDPSVRQDPLILEHQGRNRLRRARIWVDAFRRQARSQGIDAQAQLLTLPDVSHDFGISVRDGKLLDIVAEAFF